MGSDEDIKIHRKYTQLLDWKLDFLNPVYREFYEKEYNAAEVPLARYYLKDYILIFIT